MREILLNNNRYQITGDITKTAISPWKAQVRSGASLEFSDFSQAELEEYHDFRNGVGLQSDLPAQSARTWWTEGIDLSTARSTTLGPLVTTAGSLGLTPVKSLDFQGKTYVICSDGSVNVWNTVSSVWDDESLATTVEDCEDEWDTYQNPNATHTTDASDYKAGTKAVKITVDSATVGEMLAIETLGSANLTTYTKIRAQIKSQLAASSGDLQLHLCSGAASTNPTSFVDAGAVWANEASAYDDVTGTFATRANIPATSWDTNYLEFARAAINCDCVRYYVHTNTHDDINQIDVDVYYSSAWHDVYQGSFTEGQYETKYILEGTQSVTAMRVRFYNSNAGVQDVMLSEVDFGEITTETIDVPALAADTWTKIHATITTPANLGTVTKVGIKSVTDLGTEPYIIRIDDVRVTKLLSVLTTAPIDAIVASDSTDEYFVVSSADAAIYWDGVNTTTWTGLDAKCKGYLAYYDTKLRALDTDGLTLHSSPANDIDGVWTEFTLSGDFGTIYDLFEGKLLADGTPTLYSTGTEGLYSIDVANQVAYKQEVDFPNLTYSGHVGKYWNANVWVGTGYGIMKVTPSIATYIGPDQDDGLLGGYQGYIYDMDTVNNWLVYCVNGGSGARCSILKRNASMGGNIQVYTSPIEKYEYYDTGADGVSTGYGAAWVAQTFTPSTNHTVTNLKLSLYRVGLPGRATISIRATSSDKPSGADLCSGALNGDTLTTSTSGEWREISLGAGTALTATTKYAIVIRAVDGDASNYLGVRVDGTSPTYTDGALCISANSGVDWVEDTLNDIMFEEYGSLDRSIPCLHHSPSSLYTNGRLWFGEGTNVKYMMFPDTTSNVKQIGSYEYVDDSGYGKLPIFRKLASISKTALGVAGITESCNSDEKIEVYYGLNGTPPYALLGTFTTSPHPTALTFNSGLGTEFYTIQFAIKLYRGTTSTNSPELESLLFYYIPTPSVISAWNFRVLCKGEEADRTISEFETLIGTNTLVTFYPSGDSDDRSSFNVKVTKVLQRFGYDERGPKEGILDVTCEEVFNG